MKNTADPMAGAEGVVSALLAAEGYTGPEGIFEGKEGLFLHLDHLASNWLLPLGGFFITLGVGWFMTREASEAELVDETTPSWFSYGVWRVFMRYVAPLAVAAIIAAVISGKDFS